MMGIEDQIAALRAEVAAMRAEAWGEIRGNLASLEARLESIEARLPPLLGDRQRLKQVTGLSDSTITRATRAGTIRSTLVGGRRLYDLSQFKPTGRAEIAALAAEARE